MRSASIVLAVSVASLGGCSDRWEGFAYPDRNNLSKHIATGQFESLEMCRSATLAALHRFNADPPTGDYECGKNCDDGSKLGGVKVCEVTER